MSPLDFFEDIPGMGSGATLIMQVVPKESMK